MDFVEQVKSSVDIVRLVGEYVRLKKAGNRYVGLCPFHTEKTPSFGVNPVHQYFKCFGCGVGGDIFKFVMQLEGVTFFEALKTIAERHGIPMPQRAEYADPETKQRTALLQAHEIAARLFQSNLNGSMGAHARQYLEERGVTLENIAEFGLGLSADSWDQLTRRLEQEGFAADLLENSGLVSRRQETSGFYDRFRSRLMFPIQNEAGRVIAFGGRALKPGDEPKYLNSPKTSLYDKSNTLYNLHRAKKEIRKLDRVILVEGYMDVIGVYSAGVHEVVASCGTALTNSQVRALKRHSARIVVNFDPDTAGANASEKSIQMLLDEDLGVHVLELPGEMDPDEYVKQNGAEAYRKTIEKAPWYYFWLADRTRKKFDTGTSEGRMDAWKVMLPAIERIRDHIERAAVAKDMAVYLGVDEGLVLERFRRMRPSRPGLSERQDGRASSPVVKGTASRSDTAARSRGPSVPPMERLLLNALLKSEEARQEILPAPSEGDVAGDRPSPGQAQRNDKMAELLRESSKSFVTRNIFEALFAVAAAHGERHSPVPAHPDDKTTDPLGEPPDVLTFSNLEARLGDADKDLLHRLVFADEDSEENLAVEQVRDCMKVLERQDQELRRSNLKSRVQAAERSGDLAEALRLSQELRDLEGLLRKQRGR